MKKKTNEKSENCYMFDNDYECGYVKKIAKNE